jgi:NAD-dependent SIR2 family protein deacetylase
MKEYCNKSDSFALIKPNGSFNWAICSKCKKTVLFSPYEINENFYDNKTCSINNCKGKLEPLIVAPHEKQNYITKLPFDKAKERLEETEKVTIIGYSFPEYDKEVRKLFKEHLNHNAIVEVIDYEENEEKKLLRKSEMENKYKGEILNNNSLNIYLDGFEKYVN